jgi:hypothetical protein
MGEMKNWKSLAEAGGLDIPPADVDRIVEPLNALEKAFRPLVKDLPADLEPAFQYRQEDEA